MVLRTQCWWFSAATLFSLVAAQGLPAIISETVLRFSECTSFIQTCPPTRTSCASIACQQCTGVGYKAINSCCLEADPAACLQTYVATANGAAISAAPSAAASSVSLDAYGQGCGSWSDLYASCQAATPGFSNLPDSRAATCLCYSSNSWVPNVFDGYISSCASYFSENSDETDARVFATNEDYCSSVGNVMNAGGSVTTTATTATSNSAGGATTGSVSTQTTATATGTSAGACVKVPGRVLSVASLVTVLVSYALL